jgi:MGT family glycosyltransferase
VFVIEESFAGTLQAQGFEERLVRFGPPPEVEEEPGQFWKDFIRETAPVFRKPTIEQLAEFVAPTFGALCDGARYVDDRLAEILDEVAPDAVVEDNVVAFPAILASGRPWARIVSCNPLEVADPALPPVFSGYPLGDRSGWDAFREEYLRAIAELHDGFSAFCVERGAPALAEGALIHESPFLDLYLFPAEINYPRAVALAPTWHRIDSCVREAAEPFTVPGELGDSGSLVYVSLGSLGSADVALMTRLIRVLSDSPHRFIVSKGPQHAELELADNMWGAEYLPQPAILPHVDLVVTHAGNNTTTESLHFGKPIVALPLFWDQYDNAQRVEETGVGVRLETYAFEDAELLSAIERLLVDDELGARLRAISNRLQADPGRVRAADLIEQLARSGQPITGD